MRPFLLNLVLATSLCAAGCNSGDDDDGGFGQFEGAADGGGTGGSVGSGGGSGGDSTGSGGDSTGSGGDSTGTSALSPGVCEEREVKSERATPDILLMLDRSFSMSGDRWTKSVAAVESVASTFESSLRLGLMLFPGTGGGLVSCNMGELVVPVGFDVAADVQGALAGSVPGGATPIAESLEVASSTLLDLDGANPRYLVMVTDGAPTCVDGVFDNLAISPLGISPEGMARSQATLEAMTAAGIKTYVVGLGTRGVATQLSLLAAAGGTGAHHEVDRPEDLATALEEITGGVLSCSFTLKEAPPDPSYVQVLVDGAALGLGDADGFDLAPGSTEITIQGAACDTLRTAGDHELKVRVACSVVHPD